MDDAALSQWLHLRERLDHASRSAALTHVVRSALPGGTRVRVLDLATGTGSNLRYLVERLPASQHWLVVDRSRALLSEVTSATAAWAADRGCRLQSDSTGFVLSGEDLDCRVDSRCADLGALEAPALFEGRHLITAAALLDVVSGHWLRALAAQCRAAGAAVLLALTYDGRFTCLPPDPDDELVRSLFNRHQTRDKGFGGPAEGPGAAACAERCWRAEGYEVQGADSDWGLTPRHAPIQRRLIDGWAEAATEEAPQLAPPIASWRARRLAHVEAGRSRLVVGHRDLAAWLV